MSVILRASLGSVCICGRFKCIVAKLSYYYCDLLISHNVFYVFSYHTKTFQVVYIIYIYIYIHKRARACVCVCVCVCVCIATNFLCDELYF